MSSANVRSIQALDDLRAALTTFSGNAQDALRAATIEVQRTLEFVAERERYWRGRVTTAQAELSRAMNAFNYCRSQVVRDSEGRVYQPPCDGEAAALRRAQDDLRQSQERLQTAHICYQQVQQAQQTFQQQTQRMSASLSDLPKANAMLTQKVNTLKGYTAMSAPSAGGAGGGVSSIGAMGGGSAGSGGGISPGGAPGVGGGLTPGYMQTVLAGLANGGTTWDTLDHLVQSGASVAPAYDGVRDLPMTYVPLSQIDVSGSSVQSAADFQSASPAMMQGWFDRLQRAVAPGVAQGANGDDFQRLDAALGLDRASGYHLVYEIFYGSDSIKLGRGANGLFDVTNGYHRLFIAHQLGLPGVPAHIIGSP